MRGMAGRWPRLESEHIAGYDVDVLLRHGHELAPEPVEVVRVEPTRARLQAGRIDEVRRTDLADVHRELRVPMHESAGRAGVVQVNVRQDEMAEILDRESLRGKAFLEHAQARRGPAIDQRRLVTGEEV